MSPLRFPDTCEYPRYMYDMYLFVCTSLVDLLCSCSVHTLTVASLIDGRRLAGHRADPPEAYKRAMEHLSVRSRGYETVKRKAKEAHVHLKNLGLDRHKVIASTIVVQR